MVSSTPGNAADIEVLDSHLVVHHLDVNRRDVAGYLSRIDAGQREAALVRVIEVGVFCLERCQASEDMEFVRLQLERLMNDAPHRFESV